MKLSVVIPAYNEAENISFAIRDVQQAISALRDVNDFEIIVVDDHSSDQTYEEVVKSGEARAKCIRLSRRSGSHVAIRAGISHATGDAVLCVSADGQDDPSVLPKMIEKWKSGQHVVWAMRNKREEPWSYKLVALMFYLSLRLLTDKTLNQIDFSNADFFLLDRRIVDAVTSCSERNTSLFGLLAWVGYNHGTVHYDRKQRARGKSKWNFRTRLGLAIDWIVAFSGLPLRLISLLGFVVALLGFLYAGFVVVNAYIGHPPPGWSETVILLLVLSGFQMLISGVIGEYIWKNLDEARRRPLFFVEKESRKP